MPVPVFTANCQLPTANYPPPMNRFWQQLAIATNWPILVAVAVLTAVGCISIAADPKADATNQLFFIVVGSAALFLFQTVNYLVIGRWSWGFYIVSLLLVIYTVMPGVPRSG